jgi:hypothetical protein
MDLCPVAVWQSLLLQVDFRRIISHGPSAKHEIEIVRFCSFVPQRAARLVHKQLSPAKSGLFIIEFAAACFYTSALEKLCLR